MTSPFTDATWTAALEAYHSSWYGNPSVEKALRAALEAALPSALVAMQDKVPKLNTEIDDALHAELSKAITGWQQGFTAGVEAAAQLCVKESDKWGSTDIMRWELQQRFKEFVPAIRALQPPAAPAESESRMSNLPWLKNATAGEIAYRIENSYRFACEAGPLANCEDWRELRRRLEAPPLSASEPAGSPSEQPSPSPRVDLTGVHPSYRK